MPSLLPIAARAWLAVACIVALTAATTTSATSKATTSVGTAQTAPPVTFNGARALDDVRALVAIGPRVAGTPGAAKARAYVATQLAAAGLTIQEQRFEATTPRGNVAMVNLRAMIPGSGTSDATAATPAPYVIVAGHYDTKLFKEFAFVGANDGGSSTAFLIELARVLKPRTLPINVELLFLDGEEAAVDWSLPNDHTYGSRHYVAAARQAGTLKSIVAMVLVDMIGDRDLKILRESASTPWLTDLVWAAAARLGRKEFVRDATPIEDDHIEFLAAGVPAVDIIDLDYPQWHEAGDTLDKLSATSFQVVGEVVLEALKGIAARPR